MKESPADSEVTSHRLMIRAGMIRKLAAGIYSILPLGLRVLRKTEQIIREEMNTIGGQEVFLPSVQPAELWQESGRWDFYGKELLRIKDRHNREFCYGPTHEEVITEIIRKEVRSYRQLPLLMYQIQTKFRDEVRPRFGVMRGREFIMKDAYSFHTDETCVRKTYEDMKIAYSNVFRRCGLDFRMVEADSGTIGGSFSHEFVVLADSGEDAIGFCEACGYAANQEKTEVPTPQEKTFTETESPLKEIDTPNKKSVEDVTQFLSIDAKQIIKTVVFEAGKELIAGLVRGDREINPIKLANLAGYDDLHPAKPETIEAKTGAPCGFIGPVGLNLRIFADQEVMHMRNTVTGSNKKDIHILNVNPKRDVKIEQSGDIRMAQERDPCPKCSSGCLRIKRGIEVGHIFILGTKYSEAMNAHYLDPAGQEVFMTMGCYGIGVGRTAAAAIEQNNDDRGIVWPTPLAPFQIVILPVKFSDPAINEAVKKTYHHLLDVGFEVLLDDRDERIGVKFKDAELIGIPLQIIIGSKNLQSGQIEIKKRKTGESQVVDFPEILDQIPEILENL